MQVVLATNKTKLFILYVVIPLKIYLLKQNTNTKKCLFTHTLAKWDGWYLKYIAANFKQLQLYRVYLENYIKMQTIYIFKLNNKRSFFT